MGERIRFEQDGGLAIITLCRPAQGNAIDAGAGRELREAAVKCATDPEIRAVLLAAEGKHFCVGGDVVALGQLEDLPASIRERTIDFHAAMQLFAQMDAPLVCAVKGAAVGAGLAMVAVSDYVVASHSAVFAYAFTGVGLSADGGLTWTLPRLMGVRNFQSFYLTGQRITAEQAAAWGIVSEVAGDDYLDKARGLARQIAEGPTVALGTIKRLLLNSFDQGFAAQLEDEAMTAARVSRSDDTRGAIAAWLAGEKPKFNGR